MKNEKFSVFAKRDVVNTFVKGLKKAKNGLFSEVIFFKFFFKKKFW